MEARELRINNYVFAHGKATRVTGMYRNFCQYDEETQESTWNFIGPIPLTEERLKELGFEYDEDKEYCSNDLLYLESRNEDKYLDKKVKELLKDSFGVWFNSDNSKFIREVKYVHQLQNLYYALTGKELVKQ